MNGGLQYLCINFFFILFLFFLSSPPLHCSLLCFSSSSLPFFLTNKMALVMVSTSFQAGAIVYMEKNLKYYVTLLPLAPLPPSPPLPPPHLSTSALLLIVPIQQMPFLSSWAWINVFEFILTFPLVVAIPLVQGIRFHDIPNNVLRGYASFILLVSRCFLCYYFPLFFVSSY